MNTSCNVTNSQEWRPWGPWKRKECSLVWHRGKPLGSRESLQGEFLCHAAHQGLAAAHDGVLVNQDHSREGGGRAKGPDIAALVTAPTAVAPAASGALSWPRSDAELHSACRAHSMNTPRKRAEARHLELPSAKFWAQNEPQYSVLRWYYKEPIAVRASSSSIHNSMTG